MTENEAIEVLQNAISESEKIISQLSKMKTLAEQKNRIGEYYSNIRNCRSEIESCNVAIESLKEVQQYREIGTVEECREAMEKQKAKKPIPINYKKYADKIENMEFLEDAYLCPNCKTVIRSGSFCGRCGQKLSWNENSEGMEDE